MENYDVIVIGGGPAGLAAAVNASNEGAKTLLVEREARLGGILKQCIHDGFGLIWFKEKLAGSEYAARCVRELSGKNIEIALLTFATKLVKVKDGFEITLVSREGVRVIMAKALILSTGCRERTSKQVFIHGTRPSGVLTAGTAQYYINILGMMPTKKCVILGSGDIGLIMARRLTLEGAKVIGVYEAKPTPSGLARNVSQCLLDYNIPLHVSHTVTRVHGVDRLTAVTIAKVDEMMKPIEGTETIVECDALILSVGLIPENELAESLNVELDPKTKGPFADQTYMTKIDGVYICGNAYHVNDLVDYVSESGASAGKSAARYSQVQRSLLKVNSDPKFLYIVPQLIDVNQSTSEVVFFFRSNKDRPKAIFRIHLDGQEVLKKTYTNLKPPEMERITADFSKFNLNPSSALSITLEEV